MKFTLRDLFWLILVVGMGLGWGLTGIKLWTTGERLTALTEKHDDLLRGHRHDLRRFDALKQIIEGEGYTVLESDKKGLRLDK